MLGEQRVELNIGTVLAGVDVAEHNATQLQIAGGLAVLAGRPLELVTVLAPRDSAGDHDAAELLRTQTRNLTTVRVHSVIIRRGDVAEEIGRCAVQEDAGLVVLGLRVRGRGQRPGAIASAVLARNRPAVLAVPATAAVVI